MAGRSVSIDISWRRHRRRVTDNRVNLDPLWRDGENKSHENELTVVFFHMQTQTQTLLSNVITLVKGILKV
jgi:hypothetical protein